MQSSEPCIYTCGLQIRLLPSLPDVGPSMSGRIESTADMVIEKYEGNLEKLREAAGKDPKKEMKLIREFKGVGETAVNIFCREAQLLWEELFPFADERTLETWRITAYPAPPRRRWLIWWTTTGVPTFLGSKPIYMGTASSNSLLLLALRVTHHSVRDRLYIRAEYDADTN